MLNLFAGDDLFVCNQQSFNTGKGVNEVHLTSAAFFLCSTLHTKALHMKTALITLTLLLSSYLSFSQQPVITDSTALITEPVLVDTSAMPGGQMAIDTPMQLQPVVVDTPSTPPTILKAEPVVAEKQPISLHMQKAKLNVRAGGYYMAGGAGAMAVGAVMTALSYLVKVEEPQLMRIAGYTFIGIGGAFSITGLGHIIHGKRMMKKPM